jgi:hypothetical protein
MQYSRARTEENDFLQDMTAINVVMHFNRRNTCSFCSEKEIGYVDLPRNFRNAEQLLFEDYFNEDCLYTDRPFRSRFRMSKNLFNRIEEKVFSYESKPDAPLQGKWALST